MATTMAQALAEGLRSQAAMGEKLLQLAGAGTDDDKTGELLGSPDHSLTVRGNIGDIVQMNHYAFLSIRSAGVLSGECEQLLQAQCPADYPGFGQFLSPRETMTAIEVSNKLKQVNHALAQAIEGLSDEELETPIPTVFGSPPLGQFLLTLMVHGGMHTGQAWGILKGAGHTTEGFEVLFF